MNNNFSFNLIDQKWINCIGYENNIDKKNLRDIFANAHTIKNIVAELPIVKTALYRLFISILHRNFGPKNYSQWKELYSLGYFDMSVLDKYFDKWHDHFDIFHAEKPFYQFIELKQSDNSDKLKGINLLIDTIHSGNNVLYNTKYFDDHDFNLSPDIVSRFLITKQTFDTCGIKTEIKKEKSSGQTPPVDKIHVLFNGKNLFETLMFNLDKYKISEDDIPSWEENYSLEPNIEKCIYGNVSSLTFLNRGIWIQPGETVNKIIITPGFKSIDQDPFCIKDKNSQKLQRPNNNKTWMDLEAILSYKFNQPESSEINRFVSEAKNDKLIDFILLNITIYKPDKAKILYMTDEYFIPPKTIDIDKISDIKNIIEIIDNNYKKILNIFSKKENDKYIKDHLYFWDAVEPIFWKNIYSDHFDVDNFKKEIYKISLNAVRDLSRAQFGNDFLKIAEKELSFKN